MNLCEAVSSGMHHNDHTPCYHVCVRVNVAKMCVYSRMKFSWIVNRPWKLAPSKISGHTVIHIISNSLWKYDQKSSLEKNWKKNSRLLWQDSLGSRGQESEPVSEEYHCVEYSQSHVAGYPKIHQWTNSSHTDNGLLCLYANKTHDLISARKFAF